MKVVLFCGGLGTRLREHSDTIPKPWSTSATGRCCGTSCATTRISGHKDFVLCLGYRGDLIREYFLNYRDEMTNDFVLTEGGKKVELLSRDFDDWRITFVDTGLHSNIGQRLLRARKYVEKEEMFLANYADGLSDVPMNDVIAKFKQLQGRRDVRVGAQRAELPHRAGGRRWRGHRHGRHERRRAVDQRRLFRAASGDLQIHGRGRRAAWTSRSSASSHSVGSRPTSTAASGRRWIPSRTRSCSTAWTRRATARGRSGRSNPVLRLLPDKKGALEILCLGAHSDDIEIGCGGSILELLDRKGPVNVTWVVLSGVGEREKEARSSAKSFLKKARRSNVLVEKFRDGYFPAQQPEVKDYFESLKRSVPVPDIVFTHVRDDLHQDHRIVSELTWNTFRNHLGARI